ncbi:hypothetical protein [Aquella oligotrophica]|uniref:Uncharacterized protein n=1 Tax=Aquella oligotrophica TaxID=2067065 RepID=A0A2I7N6F0_9NEIS|nr:hypothetical protein [Aquella oligotrophica]AUR52046.1 hypothetical protein CUN60_06950 [Aquella oligotrophica]
MTNTKLYKPYLIMSLLFISRNLWAIKQPSWEAVGNKAFSSGYSSQTKIAISPDGTPYVAFLSYVNGNDRVSVMKYSGSKWEDVGYPGINNGTARDLNLVISGDNTPYIAFEDTSVGYYRASVMKFNGVFWEYVGSPGFSNGEASKIHLAISSQGVPYVSYSDYNNKSSLIVKKFNLINWVTVGNPDISGGHVDFNNLSIDSNNIPYVAYSYSLATNYEDNKTHVKYFDGCNWESIGRNFTYRKAYNIELQISQNGSPYVAYTSSNRSQFITYFNGKDWIELNDIPFDTIQPISLAIKNNIPYIAFQNFNDNGKGMVIYYDYNQWVILGGEAVSIAAADYINMAFSSNRIAYVVYKDYYNKNKVTVMAYDNSEGR